MKKKTNNNIEKIQIQMWNYRSCCSSLSDRQCTARRLTNTSAGRVFNAIIIILIVIAVIFKRRMWCFLKNFVFDILLSLSTSVWTKESTFDGKPKRSNEQIFFFFLNPKNQRKTKNWTRFSRESTTKNSKKQKKKSKCLVNPNERFVWGYVCRCIYYFI